MFSNEIPNARGPKLFNPYWRTKFFYSDHLTILQPFLLVRCLRIFIILCY